MKFNVLQQYDENIDNGLMIVDVLTDDNKKVCQITHSDLMGGVDEFSEYINPTTFKIFLNELENIFLSGNIDLGLIEFSEQDNKKKFINDTTTFLEIYKGEINIIDRDVLAHSLSFLSTIDFSSLLSKKEKSLNKKELIKKKKKKKIYSI